MQAAQLNKYQSNFKLTINQIEQPVVTEHDVLVKVRYAAVNPVDLLVGTGSVRLIQDYAMPLIMGNELSGVVERIGSGVAKFKVGDAVYGRLPLSKIGAFAEFVAIDQAALAKMPSELDFKHSAAVPLTGLTAYQALHDELHAHTGQSVMIPGGSGSFGQLAIPMAHAMGLKVMVSGNKAGREVAFKLGADQYFDYRAENYWEQLEPVDFVIDTVGVKELSHELMVLKPGGTLSLLNISEPTRPYSTSYAVFCSKKKIRVTTISQLTRFVTRRCPTFAPPAHTIP